MRVLITGAQGQLGRACYKIFSSIKGIEVIHSDIEDFDLLSSESDIVEFIGDIKPDVVVHTGAYTDVDGAEENGELAHNINALGTKKVARGVKSAEGRLIYISTDYVFDGDKSEPYTEEDEPNPISVYGRTKYEGEMFVSQTLENYCIVRSAWLYSDLPQSFVSKILKKARRDSELNVVDDQTGSPTCVLDLARTLVFLLDSEETGIFHIVNEGSATWYDFALEILRSMGMDDVKVTPVSSNEYQTIAKRPRYSVLSSGRFEETFDIRMRNWETALVEFMKEYAERH